MRIRIGQVIEKIRLLSEPIFERRSRSREPVVETFEHCFRSPLVTTITPAMCNRVCSSCTWHPHPAVSFARRILWLECDCKGGDKHETFSFLETAAAQHRATASPFSTCPIVCPASYQNTFLSCFLWAIGAIAEQMLAMFWLTQAISEVSH